ncbi:pentatricopeptide repeat-containing protein [Populus alba x Populus x berolinensis]|nr:pentatricopeptide repeat-containing protein [Populus alba x Populus x berolinensis]
MCMNFFHRRLLGLSKPQAFKPLHYSLAPNPTHFDSQFSTKQPPSSQHSNQDPSKTIATQLSNSSSLQELNQTYAHVIRTHVLDIYTAPFHWNNLIRCYTRLGAPNKALQIYVSMSQAGISPDNYTLPIVLKAACQSISMELGRQLHSIAIRLGLELNEYCESGFISLYSKSGDFGDAYKVFEENLDRKLGSWNVLLEAKSFVKPDMLMLNSLIDMYGKCGRMDLAYMVQEGRHYFDMMRNDYGIMPRLQHYGCLVDLLGRAGLLKEAREIVEGMPMKANVCFAIITGGSASLVLIGYLLMEDYCTGDLLCCIVIFPCSRGLLLQSLVHRFAKSRLERESAVFLSLWPWCLLLSFFLAVWLRKYCLLSYCPAVLSVLPAILVILDSCQFMDALYMPLVAVLLLCLFLSAVSSCPAHGGCGYAAPD